MASYVCPKCGGADFFMSKRNVTKGVGLYTTGTTEEFPVCRTCNEIMTVTESDGEFIFGIILIVAVVITFVFLGFALLSS